MIDGCRLAIAPMMGWSDRHFRELMRVMLGQVEVYTEMVSTGAIIHHPEILQDHAPSQSILQIGGCCPQQCLQAVERAKEWGYKDVNLNVGCPSDRVQNARIGVILMKDPHLVKECVQAMMSVSGMNISVKTRLGVDENDSFEFINDFIATVAQSGCDDFAIHARKAWLKGLSPKQNRDVPPLNYERYFRLESTWPGMRFSLNGGIKTADAAKALYQKTHKLMIGRLSIENIPELLKIAALAGSLDEADSFEMRWGRYLEYVRRESAQGVPARLLLKPLMAMLVGVRGARDMRRMLSESAMRSQGLSEALLQELGGFFQDVSVD